MLPLVSIGDPTGPGLKAAQIDGNSGGYRLLSFDLSGFTGPTLKLRIQFTSDGGVEYSGAAIDDLVVTGSNIAPVTAAFSTGGTSSSGLARRATTAIGTVKITPERDWVRATHLVVHRTGNATDADVPSVQIKFSTGKVVTRPFVNGVATLDGLARDGSTSGPITFKVSLRVVQNAVVGRTAGLTIAAGDVTLAGPDVMAPDGVAAITPRPII
jgi:hypothetical protein